MTSYPEESDEREWDKKGRTWKSYERKYKETAKEKTIGITPTLNIGMWHTVLFRAVDFAVVHRFFFTLLLYWDNKNIEEKAIYKKEQIETVKWSYKIAWVRKLVLGLGST